MADRPAWQNDIFAAIGFLPKTTKEVAKKIDIGEDAASQILNLLARQHLVVRESGPDGEDMWRLPPIHTVQTTPR